MPRSLSSILPGAVAFATLLLGASAACADDPEPRPEQKALADLKFREGKKLLDENRVAEACARLDESQRLYPRGGTVLNLGLCHAREGKTATAWGELNAALKIAEKEKKLDRVRLAREAIAKLEPLLSWITVRTTNSPAGLEVRRNGETIEHSALGIAVPADPGPQTVEAAVPGAPVWRTVVNLQGEGDRKEVLVPVLTPPQSAAAARSGPTVQTEMRSGAMVGIGIATSVSSIAPILIGAVVFANNEGSDHKTGGAVAMALGGLGVAGGIILTVVGAQQVPMETDGKAEALTVRMTPSGVAVTF